MASAKPLTCLLYAFFCFKDNLQVNTAFNKASIPVHGQIKETTTRVYVIVVSQALVGYRCYYTRPRTKPEIEC